jgi:hypothetical protein
MRDDRGCSVLAAVEDQHASVSAAGDEAQILGDFRCVEMVEEPMYGHLRKDQ